MPERTPLPPVPVPPPPAAAEGGANARIAAGLGAGLGGLVLASGLSWWLLHTFDLGPAAGGVAAIVVAQISACLSTLFSPRRPFAAGSPPLLLPVALMFLFAWFFKGYAGGGQSWFLMPLRPAAVVAGPGFVFLIAFWWLRPRLGTGGARLAALGTGLVLVAVVAWAPWTPPAARRGHGTLDGVSADVQRLVQTLQPGQPELRGELTRRRRTWLSAVPDRICWTAGHGVITLSGLTTDPGPAGLTALDLGQGGVTLVVQYGSLTKSAGDRGWLFDRSIGPEAGPYLTPALLAQRGYLRPEVAARFRPVPDGRGPVDHYEAELAGLVLEYRFQPARRFYPGQAQLTGKGRYRRPGD